MTSATRHATREAESACKDAGQRQTGHVGQSAFGIHLTMLSLTGNADLELKRSVRVGSVD